MSAERWSNVKVECDALGQAVSIKAGDVDIEGITQVTWDFPAGSLPTVTLVIEDVDVIAQGREQATS